MADITKAEDIAAGALHRIAYGDVEGATKHLAKLTPDELSYALAYAHRDGITQGIAAIRKKEANQMRAKTTSETLYVLHLTQEKGHEYRFPGPDAGIPGASYASCIAKALEFNDSSSAVATVSINRVIASYGFDEKEATK